MLILCVFLLFIALCVLERFRLLDSFFIVFNFERPISYNDRCYKNNRNEKIIKET